MHFRGKVLSPKQDVRNQSLFDDSIFLCFKISEHILKLKNKVAEKLHPISVELRNQYLYGAAVCSQFKNVEIKLVLF